MLRSQFLGGLLAAASGPIWAAPSSACRPLKLAFYELGLLYFRGANGAPKGIDLDVVAALTARTGCLIETTLESRVRIWQQLAGHQLDLTVSGIATPERERFAEFVPYFQVRNHAVLRSSLPAEVKSMAGFLELSDRRVGVVKSFKHGPVLDAWLARLRDQARVVEAADFDTVVRLFEHGRIDAFLALPTSWLLKLRQSTLGKDAEMLDWAPQDRLVHGLVMSKQRLSVDDRDRLRRGIDGLRADGSLLEIFKRHVGPTLAQDMLLPAT